MNLDNPILLWFRLDLRLEDNPALHAAIQTGRPIIPLFIWAPEEEAPWQPGAASKAWLYHSLKELVKQLKNKGNILIIREGNSLKTLEELQQNTQASAIYWNRRYEPALIERDKSIKSYFRQKGVEIKTFNSSLLFEPWEILTQQEKPYQVYTPFSNVCFKKEICVEIEKEPKIIKAPKNLPQSSSLENLRLKPSLNWDTNFYLSNSPGEAGAQKKLNQFLSKATNYQNTRDFPELEGNSGLSPHIHFGEISVRKVWNDLRKLPQNKDTFTFLKELLWREFAYHLLYHFPQTTHRPLKEKFEKFPWENDSALFDIWKKGKTGFPLVDAGMRELWNTGLMHNRVRMIVASFLIKDLLIDWQEGAKWFWDTLVDADLASNTLGWQWCAGCGADAAPFFRIFNPTSQLEKFDPNLNYVKKWIPEFGTIKYPKAVVDHSLAREKALAIFKGLS